MEPGSIVVFLEDPLNTGKLVVVSVEADGWLLCEAVHPDAAGHYQRDVYRPHDLELFDVWNQTAEIA